jgi:hypothetical protein
MTPWLRQVVQDAQAGFAGPEGDAARYYLRGIRGIPDAIAIAAGVGYLPCTYTWPHAADFHPWASSYLCGRLIFPFSTADGKYTGLQTRSLSQDAKGKDRYQTYVLPGIKGVEPPLFHAEHAARHLWQHRMQVVLVEGPIDALAVCAAGEPCVVAVLTGTPPLATRRWCQRWAGSVLALLDMDAAGRRGVETLTDTPGLLVSAPAYGDAMTVKDPGALWLRHPAVLCALVAQPSADDVLTYLKGWR